MPTPTQPQAPARLNRAGVALIIVLGFLSLMVMLALAFVTQARVERLVSDYTLGAMQCRNLLRTALVDGMNTYSRSLWSESGDSIVAPSPENNADVFLSGDDYKNEHTFGTPIGEDVDLLSLGVDNPNKQTRSEFAYTWIPSRYWDYPVEEAQWVYVTAKDPKRNEKTTILGRYAYACFDMSGGLDANLLGLDGANADTDTWNDRSNIRNFPQKAFTKDVVPDVKSPDLLNDAQIDYWGFDTLYELTNNAAGAVYSGSLNHLVPYSMSAFRGSIFHTGSGTWDIPQRPDLLDASLWAKYIRETKEDIFKFVDATNNLYSADLLAKAIGDYMSKSPIPAGINYPSPKNVPMLNEVQVSLRYAEDLSSSPPIRTLTVTLTPEFWYPFPSKDNNPGGTFTLPSISCSGGKTQAGPSDIDIWIAMALRPTGENSHPDFVTVTPKNSGPISISANYNSGKPYTCGPLTFTLPLASTNQDPCSLMIRKFKFQKPLKITHPRGDADAAFLDPLKPFDFLDSMLTLQPNKEESFGAEAHDPRFNHDPGNWSKYRGSGSLNAVNKQTLLAISQNLGISNPSAGDYAMYCRNRPMETPGELGFIPLRPWETIDLFSVDAATLMRHLASINETNPRLYPDSPQRVPYPDSLPIYTNGTINPNTHLTNVLQSAFSSLTLWGIPNWESTQENAQALSEDVVRLLAARIVEKTGEGQYQEDLKANTQSAFCACSDWVTAFASPHKRKELETAIPHKNVRDSLVRQTWGLFRPEDNLFTIVVIAQAIKEGPTGTVGKFNEEDDMIVGEKRAVALVWRDPFPVGKNLHHEMSIVMYKALTD